MEEKVLIVAGTRGIKDEDVVRRAIIDSGFVFDKIVAGGAGGVDSLAIEIAKADGIPYEVMAADWNNDNPNKYGRGNVLAGYARNEAQSKVGDMLVAVWDGKSTGTLDMISRMRSKDKPYYVHRTDDESQNSWHTKMMDAFF